VTATKEEIGVRVDALAQAHTGDGFVAATERLAAELDVDDRAVLQQVLLERAADQEDFQQALRQRVAETGWIRRTFGKLERLWATTEPRRSPMRSRRAGTARRRLRARPKLSRETAAEPQSSSTSSRDTRARA
jgi:hypothetical protein